jgi:hypothetical protein
MLESSPKLSNDSAYLVDLALVVIVEDAYDVRTVNMLGVDKEVIYVGDGFRKTFSSSHRSLELWRVSIEVAQ